MRLLLRVLASRCFRRKSPSGGFQKQSFARAAPSRPPHRARCTGCGC